MAASHGNAVDFSGSVIERFLDAVQQHPCVYDTKRLDYRDVDRKSNAWELIRSFAGLSTVEECLKLWKRLRDRYTRELKAIEQTKRSGSGYVSRRAWEFAESMAFYRDCGRPRKTTCSMEAPSYSGSDDVGETAESILTGLCTTPPSPSADDSFLDAPPELPPQTTPASLAVPTTLVTERYGEAPPKQKNKRRKTESFEDELLGQLQKKMSENEAFGLSIGLSLDKLPRKMASKCKVKIMQLIAEAEEEID